VALEAVFGQKRADFALEVGRGGRLRLSEKRDSEARDDEGRAAGRRVVCWHQPLN
jgi:hypothetical protein